MPVVGLSDTAPSSEETINLIIIHNGNICQIDVNSGLTVEKVIALALERFASESVGGKADFKLVSTSSRCALRNDYSVLQCDLKSNDELLLVLRRSQPTKEDVTEENLQSPTAQEILEATKNIQPRNMKRPIPLECSSDFHSEIRKIFISLSEVSASLLSASPKADAVIAMLCDSMATELDQPLVQQLIGLGFAEQIVVRALRVNRMNKADALDWLLREEGGGAEAALTGESSGQPSILQKKAVFTQTVTEYVAWLLESFRIAKKRDFRPNAKAMAGLKAMGFEDEALNKNALLVSGNNPSAACAWILGECHPSLEDQDTGLDINGPIYKGIMANPEIQLSIHNPRMLLAFLSMIENPDSIKKWLNDVDASSVISQIFKTYQSEKRVQEDSTASSG